MSFFKRKSPSNVDITGFWSRGQGEVLIGRLIKHVANDSKGPKNARPFFIFELVETKDTGKIKATLNVEDDDKPVKAGAGMFAGVAANWALTSVIDKVTDIGKVMKMTVTGEAENPNGGKPMKLIDVEVDEPTNEQIS